MNDHLNQGGSGPRPRGRPDADVLARARHLTADPYKLSPATISDYKKKCHFVGRQMEAEGRRDLQALIEVISRYAAERSESTFRGYRAAASWMIVERIKKALASLEQAGSDDADARGALVALIAQWLETHEALQHLHPSRQPASAPINRREDYHGKKEDFRKLQCKYPQWLGRILLAMRRTEWIDYVRLAARIGCRPEELVKGVLVEWVDESKFAITVDGAKRTESAGQKWRRIELPISMLPFAWKSKLLVDEAFTISPVQSKDGLRAKLKRVSKRIFRGAPEVTVYTFRHALASRLRAAGHSSEDVAGFLGHSAAATQKYYGYRSRRGGGVGPQRMSRMKVSTERPVRSLNRSGLSRVLNSDPPYQTPKL